MVQFVKYMKYVCKICTFVIFMLFVSTHLNGIMIRPRIQKLQIWNMNYDPFNAKRRFRPPSLKYILIWSGEDETWDCLKEKQIAFQENNCEFDNCFVTRDKDLLGKDIRNFDALLINGKFLGPKKNKTFKMPDRRIPKQLYIFSMRESADNYPMCADKYDKYFNLTWTYRLDSDATWPYLSVFDFNGKEVAPNINVKWIPEYLPIVAPKTISNKEFAATWFVSNCYTNNRRESFFNEIKAVLTKSYKLEVDVVGGCGSKECPMEKDNECLEAVRLYYFYFAFENSFATDYVTEKVIRAMLHNSVPVVYGAADYNRFLPPHSFINARKLGVEKTAATMAYLIKNQTAYLEYFQWRNHYRISQSTSGICNLCKLLNKNMPKTYVDFRPWWNPDFKKICRSRLRDRSNVVKYNVTMRVFSQKKDDSSSSSEENTPYQRLLVRQSKTDFISRKVIQHTK